MQKGKKVMTQEELNKVLERHLHWIRGDCEGWNNMCADFSYKNLEGMNLAGVNLICANFLYANLKGVNLTGANLKYVNLEKSNLKGAKLKDVHLASANMAYANLEGVNLENTNLRDVQLAYANLEGANLRGANLEGANLRGAKNLPFISFACPDTGSFIGWKRACGKIIKLEIPADAKRLSATSKKCRCDKAKVLEIQEIDGSISDVIKISSDYDRNFIYEVGKTVSIKDFCEDRWRECSQGIHFFISRQSAVEYF